MRQWCLEALEFRVRPKVGAFLLPSNHISVIGPGRIPKDHRIQVVIAQELAGTTEPLHLAFAQKNRRLTFDNDVRANQVARRLKDHDSALDRAILNFRTIEKHISETYDTVTRPKAAIS